LAKAPQKATARPQAGAIPVNFEVQQTKRVNIFSKVRGLLIMAIGATLIGFGMGGVDVYLVALLMGLEILLYGFVWLAD